MFKKTSLSEILSGVAIAVSIVGLVFSFYVFKVQNQKDNHELATGTLLLSPIQMKKDEVSAKVTTLSLQNNIVKLQSEAKEFKMYPVKLKVMSGTIVEYLPIFSYFEKGQLPIIDVGSPTNLSNKKLKEMSDDDIKLHIEEVGSFYDNYFYQSYLIKGADKSNLLIMIWYDKNTPSQGVLTHELSLNNYNNNFPEEVVSQYKQLYDYLEDNGFSLS